MFDWSLKRQLCRPAGLLFSVLWRMGQDMWNKHVAADEASKVK